MQAYCESWCKPIGQLPVWLNTYQYIYISNDINVIVTNIGKLYIIATTI